MSLKVLCTWKNITFVALILKIFGAIWDLTRLFLLFFLKNYYGFNPLNGPLDYQVVNDGGTEQFLRFAI